jgi:hypothetical protein
VAAPVDADVGEFYVNTGFPLATRPQVRRFSFEIDKNLVGI